MFYIQTIKSYLPPFNVYFIAFVTLLIPLGISKIMQYLHKNIDHNQVEKVKELPTLLSYNFEQNITLINETIGNDNGTVLRTFKIGGTSIDAAIIYIDDLVDTNVINNNILKPLMDGSSTKNEGNITQDIKDYMKDYLLPVSEIYETSCADEIVHKVIKGNTALILEELDVAIIIKTTKSKTRDYEEPPTESLVRGPRIGFNEDIHENMTLLRKLAVNTDLQFIHLQVGSRFKKELVITYIEGIASPELVDEVKKKIEKINIDHLPESGYIEQLIEENYFSIFPQIQSTERPDRLFGAIAEGRIGIILDGSPFALIAPVTLNMFIQSPEDYYERWIPGSLIRFLRYIASFIAVFTPALYISFVSFHQGLIPSKLAISIIESREGVPFPIIIEALFMEIAIEILREAGLRLPKPIGQTIGIVGGLVIGEAAVQAGIVSPVTVIVVALTAISSFSLPLYNISISLRLMRFIAMFLAATFGLYGVVVFFLFICIHLVKLKSFGIPYLSPIAPYYVSDWKDFIFRLPLQLMKKRPQVLQSKDSIRKS
nr:spore germination protein [Alkalihalobacillus sp. BA299]